MDASVFWDIIGTYNQKTFYIQVVLFLFVIISLILSYLGVIKNLAKTAFGAVSFFIGIVFFGIYGSEAIQKFFALPLYLCVGFLFLYESVRNKNDTVRKPNILQASLLVLIFLYPLISFIFGGRFPKIVTYIMPCPFISLAIVTYAGYENKNIILLSLLCIWGLTGIKSLVFNAYEDIILLILGIYALVLIWEEIKKRMNARKLSGS